MNHVITYNFHVGKGIISTLIRFFSAGSYSHASIRVGDVVYEAQYGKGVRKVAASLFPTTNVKATLDFMADDAQMVSVTQFLEDQVGKRYDYLGILSFLWMFVRQKEGKWFCSELATVSLMKLLDVPTGHYNQRQSPFDFYQLCLTIQAIVR